MKWPILDPQFFRDHPPSNTFWEGHKGKGQWSPDLLPLYEWDGLLYVASVDPESLDRSNFPPSWVVVHCPAAPLATLWSEWNDRRASEQPALVPQEFPQKAPQKDVASMSLEELMDQSPDEPVDPRFRSKEAQNNDFDLPEGLAPSGGSPTKDPYQVVSTGAVNLASLRADGGQAPAASQKPTVPPIAKVSGSDKKTQLHAKEISTADLPELPQIPDASDLSELPGIPELPEVPEISAERQQPEPQTSTHTSVGSSKITATNGTAVAASEFTQTGATRTAIRNYSAPSVPKKRQALPVPTSDSTERLAKILQKLPGGYERALIARKSGNSMRVIFWREDHETESYPEFDFSLSIPSPFRLVTRTEKPYHGFVIETPFLKQFFHHWNGGQQPETLTVVPLREKDEVTGYLITMGSSEASERSALTAAESIGSEILKLLPSLPQSPAA